LRGTAYRMLRFFKLWLTNDGHTEILSAWSEDTPAASTTIATAECWQTSSRD
jgi:hypothetical protein